MKLDSNALIEQLEQVKKINDLLGVNQSDTTKSKKSPRSSIYDRYVDKYVICRTRNEGINCGKVIHAEKGCVVIADARRIYYHKPKDKTVSWYEGVAMTGLSPDSKISTTVIEKVIVEDYSLTICTDVAEKSLRSHEALQQG